MIDGTQASGSRRAVISQEEGLAGIIVHDKEVRGRSRPNFLSILVLTFNEKDVSFNHTRTSILLHCLGDRIVYIVRSSGSHGRCSFQIPRGH